MGRERPNPPGEPSHRSWLGVVEDGTPTGPGQVTMENISQELEALGIEDEAESRAQPLEPEPALKQWGSTPEEKQTAFQGIVGTHLFKEFWRPVELEAGPCTPLLEVIPGDGDCLCTAISKYLDFCRQNPLTLTLLRRLGGDLILSEDPKNYAMWHYRSRRGENPTRGFTELHKKTVAKVCVYVRTCDGYPKIIKKKQ